MNRYLTHNTLIHLKVIWSHAIVDSIVSNIKKIDRLYEMFDKFGMLVIQNVPNKMSLHNSDGLLLSLVEYFSFFQGLPLDNHEQYKLIVQSGIQMINFNQSNKISHQIY